MKQHISPNAIRRIILDQSMRAHVGHIGSALSIADIIAALYSNVLNISSPDDPDRDRFVLSKGHAALALYAALALKGWIPEEQLDTYCGDNSLLGVHTEHILPGVDFSTGSLGHGLSMGTGAALAARLQNSSRRVFVLISDAECNEGSVWEAVMFAAHHKLANLIAIVDLNGQQALGYTKDVMSLPAMADRWKAFGWDTHEVDGHDVDGMSQVMSSLNTKFGETKFGETKTGDTKSGDTASGQPHVLIAHTVFGKGVSYMESQIKWHYWPMSDEEYQEAIDGIGAVA